MTFQMPQYDGEEGSVELNPPPTPSPDLVDLTAKSTQAVSPPVALDRATRADYGWPEGKSPGVPFIQSSLVNGDEDSVRQKMYSDSLSQFTNQKIDAVKTANVKMWDQDPKATNEFLTGLIKAQPPYTPDTVVEHKFAQTYFDTVVRRSLENDPTSPVNQGMDKDFHTTLDKLDVGQTVTTANQIIKSKAEIVDANIERMGMGSYALNLAKSFLPGYQSYISYNKEVEGVFGTNREADIMNIWGLAKHPEKMKAAIEARLESMSSDPLAQQSFIHALQHYSNEDKVLDTIFGVADVVTVGQALQGTGKIAVKVGSALARRAEMAPAKAVVKSAFDAAKEAPKADPISTGSRTTVEINGVKTELVNGRVADPVSQAVKDATQAVGRSNDPAEVLAANGHITESADIQAVRQLQGPASAQDVQSIASQVPSLFNIDTITSRAGSLARGAAEDLAGRLREQRTKFVDVITDHNQITRAPDEAYAVGVKEAREELSRRYPTLDRLVLDVQTADGELLPYWFNLPEDSRASIGSISIRLGDTEKNLFPDARAAANHAVNVYGLNADDPGLRIRQQGDKWFIELSKNLDEASPNFRAALITTKNTTPLGWANTLLGKFRSPEDTLSQLNRENRHTLTHGTERMKEAFQQIAEDSFKDLSKKEEGPLLRVLKANQAFEGPDGKQGMFYKNVQEFEDAYFQLNGHRASPAQARAYFGYVQLSDMDYVVRNLGWYRDKARQGIENWSFSHHVPNEEGISRLTKVKPFEGKAVSDIPWDHSADAGIYVVDKDGVGTVVRKNSMTESQKAAVREEINNGSRVIHVYQPDGSAVGKKEPVHFIVVKDASASQLSWQQAPYQAGGHRVYVDGFHTKQGKIEQFIAEDGTGAVRHRYTGDVAAFSHSTEAEAIEKSAAMEKARTMLPGHDQPLTEHLINSGLPYTAKQFRNLFEDSVVNGKTIEKYFDKDLPFLPTKTGQSTAERAASMKQSYESRFAGFEDVTASPFNLSNTLDKKYAGTRDAILPRIERRGSETNPVFQLGKSPLLDPMTTLNQSLGGIIRNRLMTDHKTYAIESWASEFAHLMEKPDEVRANPFLHFHDPKFRQDAPLGEVNAARNSLMNLKNLLGTEGDADTLLRNAVSSVLDFVYKKTGKDGVERLQNIAEHTPDWMISAIKDPAAFMRTMAFHPTIGMFNPVQLLLQAQTMVHSVAVGGLKNGSAGMMAGNMMRILGKNANPGMLERMAQISESMRKFMPHMLGKEEFIESYNAFVKSGLHIVEGEVGALDRQTSPKMFSNAVGNFFHKGAIFFQEGERLVRYTAWNTAYKEWKATNPTRLLNNEARGEILGRANLFGANMTRASSAAWQQGSASVITQFWGYPMRLAEQMAGKRLTVGEKLHAFATYSAIYGVPAGLSLSAVPAYDDIKTYALDKGYNMSDKYLQSFMQGIPHAILTAAGVPETDFASRMGVNGLTTIHDALHGNLSAFQFISGASGSILGSMVEKSSPLFKSLLSTVRGDDKHPLQLADFVEAASSIKTLDYGMKAAFAASAGIYANKNGLDLTKVSPAEAALLGLGLTPLRVKEANLMNLSSIELKKSQKAFETLYEKEVRFGLKAAAEDDIETAKQRFRRSQVYFEAGRFQESESGKMLMKAIGMGEDNVDLAHNNFLKNAPKDELNARQKARYPGYPDMKAE